MRFFIIHFYRGIDVENAIKLAAADDGYVTYDELRENLRKYRKSQKISSMCLELQFPRPRWRWVSAATIASDRYV